ncbi:MAG: DNA polymerase III subunit beta [Candidatus Cloacimonetes bacterium]|nr:DNA polymerase III subunit beta [Candidatus Cloacimonadota bacterium]
MRFTIERSQLLSSIQYLQSIVPTKNITPILTNFLIEADAENNRLRITCTDLEITVMVKITAQVAESGKVAIMAKNLTDIINSLEDKPINLYQENEYLKIRCSHSSFSLLCADYMQFPQIPDINMEKALTVSAPMLAKMVNISSIAVLQEVTRPIFTGIYWRISTDSQTMVATDGKKIVEVKKEHSLVVAEDLEHVIPTKGLFFLEKVIEEKNPDLKVLFEANRIIFGYDNYVVITQVIPGRFPDYEKVLKVDNPHTLTIDKGTLRQAVKRVSLLASEEFFRIKFDISPEKITLYSVNSEMGDATEVIDDHQYSGPSFSIAFNYKYILSVLNVLESDKVKMTFGQPEGGFINTQVIIYNEPEPKDYHPVFLLMPLRLK